MSIRRPLIAAMQVTLDGSIQDPDGMSDWVDSWADGLELLPPVDAFVLGGGMFPEYEQFWTAILEDPARRRRACSGGSPYPREVDYARLAAETPHLVLSRTLADTTLADRADRPRPRRARRLHRAAGQAGLRGRRPRAGRRA